MKFYPKWRAYCASEHGVVICAEQPMEEGDLVISHLLRQEHLQAMQFPAEEISWHIEEITAQLKRTFQEEQQ